MPHLDKSSVKPKQITDIIKGSSHGAEALISLTRQYHEHVMASLKSCLRHMDKNQPVTVDKQKFTNPLHFVDYVFHHYLEAWRQLDK